jgi:regulator of sirC expression with transglutaminase-like and TPR domain
MEPCEQFAQLVISADPPLDRASLLISAQAHPDLDVEFELARLDELAERLRPHVDGDVSRLCRELFITEGFVGDRRTYTDPANSFLDRVLSRRQGIPITLAVLLMEVGRRLDITLVGVGLPGHFLVRDANDPDTYIDAFNMGRRLDADGCEQLLREVQGRPVSLHPSWLAPVDNRAILWRMLTNLKAIYGQRGDDLSLTWVLGLRCTFPGAPEAERHELQRALARFN